ncbi:hypothetical protein AB0C51_08965 [Streptomyces pathocidini]|uniref:Small CPxCG-related zinc finger protein n=1 Tax=Streptomyces pathocidini TaxID=1650571 RepID=A0ABW7UMS2_9ACTN|nr:hypothetical protein [Streptomyces pathocidini]
MEQQTHHPAQQGAENPVVTCGRCGAATAGPTPPVTWTCSVENGHRVYFCDSCARDNLRAIEGRLDSSWW